MRKHGSVWERDGIPGNWVGKFELKGGQHWVKGSPFVSEEAAQQALEAQRDEEINRPAHVETCRSWSERWLAEWPRESPATRKLYKLATDRFVDEFEDRPLEDVSRVEGRSWALKTPRNYSRICGTMYEDARNIGVLKSDFPNPLANLRLPVTEQTKEITPPTIEEFIALLNACSVLGLAYAKEMRALIQFTAWTGLRSSEVVALQWSDLDGGEDSIDVRRALKSDGSYGLPKNQTEAETIAWPLEAQVLDQVPRRGGEYSKFVFHTPTGVKLKKGNLYYLWNKVRDNSGTTMPRAADGIKPIRFHDLRHFCATQWLERGLTPFDVSVQLRHKDGGALVMSRYGHPSKGRARGRLLAASRGSSLESISNSLSETAESVAGRAF